MNYRALAVLDRLTSRQIMAADVPTDSRAGREWWEMITQKSHQPIGLQDAAVEPDVQLIIDGSSVLIETGDQRLSIGPSEQAQINVIAGEIDPLTE